MIASSPNLVTIGYEKAQLDDFVATLQTLKVALLADIREVPVSRKAGFSKAKLSARLEGHGIAYQHFRALGDPKPGRDAAKAGNRSLFQQIFHEHMRTAPAAAALAQLSELVQQKRVCLLCYERNPLDCHRSIVSQLITERVSGLKVFHAGVTDGLAAERPIAQRRGLDPGQSSAANE